MPGPHARDADPHRGRGCDRGGGAGDRGLGERPSAHLRGRRARPLLRPDRLGGSRRPDLRRAPLGSRRRPPRASRQLADARGAPVLHGHAGRAARSHAPTALSHPRPDADGNQRRGAQRLARRRGGLRGRLPARGARAHPRHAHARHRRDDPSRPVPPDRARTGAAARHSGRAGHGQDGGRPAPRLLAALRAPRTAAAGARRRAEPGLHGIRVARPPHARRGQRRPAGRRGARGRRRGHARGPARGAAAEGGHGARGRTPPTGRGGFRGRAAGARRADGGAVRRPRSRRGRRAARGVARGARPVGSGARALPDERSAPLLRGLWRSSGRAGLPELRGGRTSVAARRAPDAIPEPRVAGAEARADRQAPAGPTSLPRVERGRPALARRGPRADPRAAAAVRPRDRRRSPGPDADAAANGRPPGLRRLHAPGRHRPGDRTDRL